MWRGERPQPEKVDSVRRKLLTEGTTLCILGIQGKGNPARLQTPETMTSTFDIPPAFYWDHVYRDLPGGIVIKETKRYVRVQLTDEERSEILSDARHYASPSMGYAADYPGLVSSARATIKRLA